MRNAESSSMQSYMTARGDESHVARIGGRLAGRDLRLFELRRRFLVLLGELRLLREQVRARRRDEGLNVRIHRAHRIEARP